MNEKNEDIKEEVSEIRCVGCGVIVDLESEDGLCSRCIHRKISIDHLKHKKKTHSEVVRGG